MSHLWVKCVDQTFVILGRGNFFPSCLTKMSSKMEGKKRSNYQGLPFFLPVHLKTEIYYTIHDWVGGRVNGKVAHFRLKN
jgi:hypothetical protein